MTRAVTPASPVIMLSMAMVWHLQWFRLYVSLAIVLVKDALACSNLIFSVTYFVLVFSTLNARGARLHMISLDHGERDGI